MIGEHRQKHLILIGIPIFSVPISITSWAFHRLSTERAENHQSTLMVRLILQEKVSY